MSEFADFEVEGLNLEEIKPWDGEQAPLVDPGEYTLMIVDVKHESGKKAAMIAITFEVQDEGAWKNQKVYNNYSLSDKALGRLTQLAIAVGAPLQGFKASNYFGQTIMATVYHTDGAARINDAGETLPARTFANVKNERPVQTAPAATTKAPPVTRTTTTATTKPATNNAAPRRA